MKIKQLLFLTAISSSIILASCGKTEDPGPGGGGTISEKTMTNVSYGTDPMQKMDIYLPANRNTATTKVIIVIHGGAWVTGDKADINPYIDSMKKRVPDYAIFNLNYRLASFPANNAFPAQELDVKAAVDFIYGNRSTYLISDKFVLMGASAGGHLALLQAYKYHTPANIKAVVDFCGPTDMIDMYNNPGTFTQGSIQLLLSGFTPTTNLAMYQQSSPIFFANASSCPTIILQGALDPLVNADRQSLALKNKLTTAVVINQYVLYPTEAHVDSWSEATKTDAFNKIQVFLATNVP